MSKMIDFGIDLGTTNSLIAKFQAGKIQVFKNPRGHKEGLPSIVGFRKDKILVGDKARDYAAKDPTNVKSRFKRKMGTTETFKVDCINASKTPEELSAFVIKELKTFVQSGENVESAVITIPASFDTIQANATKEAGTLSGLKEVVLLQEPIAASLAYANKDNSIELQNSQWIVYDLGGGTFDVALVKIVEGELTVIDHEGDNFFGGTDLDSLIVEKLVVPYIQSKGVFSDLLAEMKSASGKYEKDWYRLLDAAEDAKIELSSDTSAEIEFHITDDNDEEIDDCITITRSQFEELIKDRISETASMLKKIMTRQSLQPADLEFVLMVGGSTYIPYVRKLVEELMGIPVNTDIDPTNAIVIGAAFYAGSRSKAQTFPKKSESNQENKIKVKSNYVSNSQDSEEFFAAKIDGEIQGMNYRIHSSDGSYDSGTKVLKNRITEELPLRDGEYNLFEFNIFDAHGNKVEHESESIQIAQGRYSVAGQMLPDEISLVRDNIEIKDTKLDRIFDKNCILPTRSKRTVEVGASVICKSQDEPIKIMVVEGSSDNHALSNKAIGVLEIKGEMLTRDLLKGTEIDITFELSESRDLTISAYLNGTGQEFSQIFNPKKREVNPKQLGSEILMLEEAIQVEKESASKSENNEAEKKLSGILKDVQSLLLEAGALSEDSITDDKFKIEDRKRVVSQQIHQITSNKRLSTSKIEYKEKKKDVSQIVSELGNDQEKHQLREVIRREEVFLNSNNSNSIDVAKDELSNIEYQILLRTPSFLVNMFEHLVKNRVSMNDQMQSKNLIENGRNLIQSESWADLSMVNARLWDLMPQQDRDENEHKFITGIV
jgi:molecular chaperone DnaK